MSDFRPLLDKNLYSNFNDVREAFTEQYPDLPDIKNFACKCCGEFYYDKKSFDGLNDLQSMLDKKLTINCGHRCTKHNKEVGGAPKSMHLAVAFDVHCPTEQDIFVKYAKTLGFTGIGYYNTFIHIDKRDGVAQWDVRS